MKGRTEIHDPEVFFKFVAVDESGKYFSIFDGKTEYNIGDPIKQEVRPGHKGGLYVCESLLELLKLGPMPSQSAMIHSSWAVVRVLGWGTRLEYNTDAGGNKIAIENLVPTQVVRFPEKAKSRYLARCRRMTATALRQRQGGVNMANKPLKLTLEETQQVFQDWQHLISEFGDET